MDTKHVVFDVMGHAVITNKKKSLTLREHDDDEFRALLERVAVAKEDNLSPLNDSFMPYSH
jgi:hypothetical protein